MFRAFLKQDEVYKLDKYSKKIEIANFAESCEQAVMTFRRAYKALYKKPMSDFDFQNAFEKNRRKTKAQAKKRGRGMEALGGASDALAHLSVPGQKKNDQSDEKKGLDASSSSDSGSDLSHSFSHSSDCSSDEEPKGTAYDQTQKKSQGLSRSASMRKKSIAGLASLTFDGMTEKNLEKPVMRRIVRRNKELLDEQILSSKHSAKLFFIQLAFTSAELHEMFKEFHQFFMPSFQTSQQEVFSLFEYMSDPQMVGKKQMQEIILPMIGVNVKKDLIFGTEDQSNDVSGGRDTIKFKLSKETLKDVWEALCQGQQFVKLKLLMPLLMIFFVVYLLNDVDKRAKNFRELLDPDTSVSLVTAFKQCGLTQEQLYEPVINYLQVEQAMTKMKSSYPASLTFNQIQTILNQVKQRMDVDGISKKETKQEAFFQHKHISFAQQEELNSHMKAIESQMGLKLKLMMAQSQKKDPASQEINEQSIKLKLQRQVISCMSDSKKIRNQVEKLKKKEKRDKYFDVNDDNMGFGKWLAYQISVQMMSNQIYDSDNQNNLNDVQSILDSPDLAFKRNFKLFKEERLWWLASILHDPCGKELVNFNAIVKETLVKKMKDLMPQNFEKTLKSFTGSHTLRSFKQPFMKKFEESPMNSKMNFKMLFNQVNQNITQRKEQDQSHILFSMYDYCQVLHQCVQKTICPWATFKHVEMSVFFFIQNLVHKCESILMEQFEVKIILEHIFDYEDEFSKNKLTKSQKDENLSYGVKHFLKENQSLQIKQIIINRFRRLYGVNSKQEKKLIELSEPAKGENQESSIKDLKDMLYSNHSCFETKRDFKKRLFPDQDESLFNQGFSGLKLPMELPLPDTDALFNAYQCHSLRSQRTINRKDKILKKKKIDKAQVMKEADWVVNSLFRNQVIDETAKQTDSEIFGETFGENFMSKKQNKHYFSLLQIFGFKDESLISFINKDQLKSQYFDSKLNGLFPEDDFFECFQLVTSIENLAKFRETRLKGVQEFRQTMMSTSPDVVWNSYYARAEMDKDNLNFQKASKNMNIQDQESDFQNEALQDIFNYSSKILLKQFMRYQFRSGLNMLLNYPLDGPTLEMHEKQFEQDITEESLGKIQDSIAMIISEIELKDQRLNTAKYNKSQTFKFPEERETELNFQERIQIIQAMSNEQNEKSYRKSSAKIQCDSDREKGYHTHQIPQAESILNVFLTSQYYAGVFDDHIQIEQDNNKFKVKETFLEKEKKRKIIEKQQNMRLNTVQKFDQENLESGRLKRKKSNMTKNDKNKQDNQYYDDHIWQNLEDRPDDHDHGDHGHGHGGGSNDDMDSDDHDTLHAMLTMKQSAKQSKKIIKEMEQHMNKKAQMDKECLKQLGEDEKMHNRKHEKQHKLQDAFKTTTKVRFEKQKEKLKTKEILMNPGNINVNDMDNCQATFIEQVQKHYNPNGGKNIQKPKFNMVHSSNSSYDSHEGQTEREEKMAKKYDPQESIFHAAIVQKKKIKQHLLNGNLSFVENDLGQQIDIQALNRTHFQRTQKYRPNFSMMVQNSNKHSMKKNILRNISNVQDFNEEYDLINEIGKNQNKSGCSIHDPSSSRRLDGNLNYNFTESGRDSDDKQFFNNYISHGGLQQSTKNQTLPGTAFGSTANNTQKFDPNSLHESVKASKRRSRRQGNQSFSVSQKQGSELNRLQNQNSEPQSIRVSRRRISVVNYNARKWLQDGEESEQLTSPYNLQSEFTKTTPKLDIESPLSTPNGEKSVDATSQKTPQVKRKILEEFKPVEDTEDFPIFQVTLDEKQKNSTHKTCGLDDDACIIF